VSGGALNTMARHDRRGAVAGAAGGGGGVGGGEVAEVVTVEVASSAPPPGAAVEPASSTFTTNKRRRRRRTRMMTRRPPSRRATQSGTNLLQRPPPARSCRPPQPPARALSLSTTAASAKAAEGEADVDVTVVVGEEESTVTLQSSVGLQRETRSRPPPPPLFRKTKLSGRKLRRGLREGPQIVEKTEEGGCMTVENVGDKDSDGILTVTSPRCTSVMVDVNDDDATTESFVGENQEGGDVEGVGDNKGLVDENVGQVVDNKGPFSDNIGRVVDNKGLADKEEDNGSGERDVEDMKPAQENVQLEEEPAAGKNETFIDKLTGSDVIASMDPTPREILSVGIEESIKLSTQTSLAQNIVQSSVSSGKKRAQPKCINTAAAGNPPAKRKRSNEKNKEPDNSSNTVDVDDNDATGWIKITCGPNDARMYLEKVRLQQSNHGERCVNKCVKFDDGWLTPNEFQVVSGRGAAKDWKRTVRHGGQCIKALLTSGVMVLASSPARCLCRECTTGTDGTAAAAAAAAKVCSFTIYSNLLVFEYFKIDDIVNVKIT